LKAIVDFLKGSEKDLCPDCQRRISTNPLRVFDCKVESCISIIAGAPKILDYLCAGCAEHFSQVKSFLNDLNVSYLINPKMVRGLDYYTKTAFEIKSGSLGAQNSLAGGGRYDGLVSFLGGPEVPGIGFAVGFERLFSCMPQTEINKFQTDIFIAAMGSRAQKISFSLTNELRRAGISAAMDYSDKSLKSQMKRADKLNSSFTLIFGDKEIDERRVELRDMKTKNQQVLSLDNLPEAIIDIFKER
jgi:histidyl-tRNA synthetase